MADKTEDPNKLFLARLDKGEAAVRILLSNTAKPKVSVSQPEGNRGRQLGTMKSHRGGPTLVKKKQPKFINFYDLGWIKDGDEYVDLPFSVDTGLGVTYPTPNNPQFDLPMFTQATHWAALYDMIFDVPLDQWKTTYKKVSYEEGNQYGFGCNGSFLDGSNTNWTEQGLNPTPSLDIDQNRIVLSFDLSDTTNYKITATNDYADDEVEIDLSNGADVFLVPQPCYLSATNSGGVDPPEAYDAHFFGLWTVHSRVHMLNKTKKVFSPTDIPLFRFSESGARWSSNDHTLTYETSPGVWDDDSLSSSFKAEMYTYWKSLASALFHVRRISGGVSSNSFEAISNFPITDSSPYFEFVIFFTHPWDSGSSSYSNFIERDDGLLMAVIKIGSNWYYVWNKTTITDVSSVTAGFWTYQLAP